MRQRNLEKEATRLVSGWVAGGQGTNSAQGNMVL